MDLSEGTSGNLRHPWEVARARFFEDVLRRAHALRPTSRVLDVGAGDAFVSLSFLERARPLSVTAWDEAYSEEQLQSLSERGVTAVREPPDGPFDVVLVLDVLEHLDDEAPLLRAVNGVVASEGHVLVSVPAWPSLMGPHDAQLRHRRRYTPALARQVLERAGLVIVDSGGLFHSLLAQRAFSMAMQNRLAVTSRHGLSWTRGKGLSAVMTALLQMDTALSRGFSRAGFEVPGLSWWALCSRGTAT